MSEYIIGYDPYKLDDGTIGDGDGRVWVVSCAVKHKTKYMNFGQALQTLKSGGKVQRNGWNGKGMWVCLQVPDVNSKMTLPYIYMYTAQGDLVPWLASQTDILAEDWDIVD